MSNSYFGYLRVSTVRQGDGVSLEAQRSAIEAYAQRNNLTVVRWYEEMVTAAKSGRPAFNAMLAALRRGEANGMVVHKIDRSSRNFADWARIGDLADRGVDIHFVTETLDFRSRGGRLAADIQAVFAADYVRNLREEVIKGLNGRLKQGLYPWPAPVGYLNEGSGKLKSIDPATAPLVRRLFELYATGQYSIRSLRPVMAQLGLRNRSGRPFSKRAIEETLSNPFYAGVIRVRRRGETYPGRHQALISEQLFRHVQEVKAGRYTKKATRHSFLYRGLFRCGICSGAMTPEQQKGHLYYRCHTFGCPTKGIRSEILDQQVTFALRSVSLAARQRDLELGAFELCLEPTSDAPVEALLQRTRERLDRLTQAFLDQLIDADQFARSRAELSLQEAGLRNRLDAEKSEATLLQEARELLELSKELATVYEASEPIQKRQLLELTTSNRTVAAGKAFVEPQSWISDHFFAVRTPYGGAHKTTTRTPKRHTMRSRRSTRIVSHTRHRHSSSRCGEPLRELMKKEEVQKLLAALRQTPTTSMLTRPAVRRTS